MDITITDYTTPKANNSSCPTPTLSQFHHNHRKNHRGGAKEHARRERKASSPATPAETSSLMSAASSVSGARKNSHRAGVKYRARREAQVLYKMTSAGMELLEPEEGEEGYDSGGESIDRKQEKESNGRHDEPDVPSLTYDSDEHQEEHEEPEAEEEPSKADKVREADSSKLDLNDGGDTLVFEGKVDPEAEIGTCEEKVKTETEIGMKQTEIEEVVKGKVLDSSLPVTVGEEKVSTLKLDATLTPPKKHPIKLLSLMRPKVL
jgi:hypothetical protein